MTIAFTFPGQGSQVVGMGRALADAFPEARAVFDEVDDALGEKLSTIIFDGPIETLTLTENAQPALMAVSLAAARVLAAKGVPVERVAYVAGHSLGEYTALAATGALDYEQGLAVVAERGRAMAGAADQEASGMAAVIGSDLATAEGAALARRQMGGRLFVANINAPGQIVVAGGAEDLDWLEAEIPHLGIKRVIRLKVAGAFHSPFMEAAADRLAAALAGAVSIAGVGAQSPAAPSGDPIVVGSSLSQTGAFAATAGLHQIAGEMFVERLNANGGLLGRPVEWVLLDDQSKPDLARTLYERLVTVDKVDLLLGPYGTGGILSAMAVAQRHGKMLVHHTFGMPHLAKYDMQFPAWALGPEPGGAA